MSINKAFPNNSKGLPPTILVSIEEWDDTTDVILWLYQQKYSLNHSKITLDNPPEHIRCGGHDAGFETLENQRAYIEGSSHDFSRIVYIIEAEQIDLEDDYGYTVIVKKQNPANAYNFEKIAQYTIKGESRDTFEILKEQLF